MFPATAMTGVHVSALNVALLKRNLVMSSFSMAFERVEGVLERRPSRLLNFLTKVVLALRIRRERNQLANLSDAQLSDIGIDRAEAHKESVRRLDDIPGHRVVRQLP